jgi:hypothetical protein
MRAPQIQHGRLWLRKSWSASHGWHHKQPWLENSDLSGGRATVIYFTQAEQAAKLRHLKRFWKEMVKANWIRDRRRASIRNICATYSRERDRPLPIYREMTLRPLL